MTKKKKSVDDWNIIKVAFDVDNTLISEDDCGIDVPNYEVIDLFRILEKLGCRMYIWSGGGIPYAKRWREKLGLNAKVVEKGSFEPSIAIDDIADTKLGKINIIV